MKRYLLAIMVSAMSLSFVSADSYRDALKGYLAYGEVNTEQYKNSLGEALANVLPEGTDPAKASQIMGEYASSQMTEDLADLFEPAFRRHVSEAELKQIAKLYQDERFIALQQKSTDIMQNLTGDEEYLRFMNDFGVALGNIITGKPVQNLPEPELSESYKQTFYKYYASAGIDRTMESAFTSVFSMLTNSLQGQGMSKGDVDATIEQVKSYASGNMRTVMLLMFSKVYREDDMQYMMRASDTDAYRHCIDATTEVVGDTMGLTLGLFEKMSSWLQVHYPQYGASLDGVIEQLKKLGGK